MNSFGELHMAAAPVLVDAAEAEVVVALALHDVAAHLGRGGRLRCKALVPLLRAHLLPLHHKDRAGGRLAGGGASHPSEQCTVGPLHIHGDLGGTGGGAVSGRWGRE